MKASLSAATSLIALLLAEGGVVAPGYQVATGALLATGYVVAETDPAVAADTRLTTEDEADFGLPSVVGEGAPGSRSAAMPAIALLSEETPDGLMGRAYAGRAGDATESGDDDGAGDGRGGGRGGGGPDLGFYVAPPDARTVAGDSVFTGTTGRISLTDASAALLAASSASYAYSLPVGGSGPAGSIHEAFGPGGGAADAVVPEAAAKSRDVADDADLPLDDADLPPPPQTHWWSGVAGVADTGGDAPKAAAAEGSMVHRSPAVFRRSGDEAAAVPTASSLIALVADGDGSGPGIDAFCVKPSAVPDCDSMRIPIRVVASELPEEMSANLAAFNRLYGGSDDAANRFVPLILVMPQKDTTNVVERVVYRLMDAVRGLLR